MQSYATHYDLFQNITFNTSVARVYRNTEDSAWLLDLESADSSSRVVQFDKVVFCHGYQTHPNMPSFPGQETYEGVLMHAQQYRRGEDFAGKKVVILGISSTTSDICSNLVPHARKVYVSHRRGSVPISRYRNGVPADLLVTHRRRIINWWVQQHMPTLHRRAGDLGVKYIGRRVIPGLKLDPAWRLEPFPSLILRPVAIFDETIRQLADGSLTSCHGVKRFLGGKKIEMNDGEVIDDVDAVVCCTGYKADWTPTGDIIETSMPATNGYGGAPLRRLYMNMFPPRYADSMVLLCYSAFGKNNGFSFSDVTSMAISNIWRGVSPVLPSIPKMEAWIDEQHEWVTSRWALDPSIDTSSVRQYIFQPWQHEAAGTGLENLGWGWKGWKFWWQDREMYNLLNHGVETAHAYRFFETGKRKTWEGARREIIRQNEMVKSLPKEGPPKGESHQ